jgi:hypothetical protein
MTMLWTQLPGTRTKKLGGDYVGAEFERFDNCM